MRYLLRYLGSLLLVLWGMSVLTFVISRAIPGDPARHAAGPFATGEQVEVVRRDLGLDRPLLEQYVTYLRHLARGDLGRSIVSRRGVREDLGDFFPATVELGLASGLLAVAVAVPLGVVAAVHRGRLADYAATVLALIGACTPVFWFGLVLQVIFYKELGWFPAGGRLPVGAVPPTPVTGLYTVDSLLAGNVPLFATAIAHLVLPTLTLAQLTLGITARMIRSSLVEVLGHDYVRTARAKGVSERHVLLRHALRNALVPVLTILGLQAGQLLGGAVLTETIFSWPGIGSYAVRAVEALDFPAIMGVALLMSFVYVVINVGIDLLYPLIDPRMESRA
jgi:peptide/nickel transport system permease protein